MVTYALWHKEFVTGDRGNTGTTVDSLMDSVSDWKFLYREKAGSLRLFLHPVLFRLTNDLVSRSSKWESRQNRFHWL